MVKAKSKKERKMTYAEWEAEHIRRLELEQKVNEERDRKRRMAAAARLIARHKKMKPTPALEKDDKTLIHEHWDEKYG